MSFSKYQELALYHPQAGFYSGHGVAGRSGDFITSPEVGQLFGHVLTDVIDGWWRQMGRPDPFFVIEAAAGTGTLAQSILAAEPRCSVAMRYVTVERSATLRGQQTGKLPLKPADVVLDREMARTKGPLVTSLADLPDGPLTGVIIANELLDNLPIDIYERNNRTWHQLCVGVGTDGELKEVLVPVPTTEPIYDELQRMGNAAPNGSRVPIQSAAAEWVAQALQTLDRGKVLLFDYVRTTRWMLGRPWEDWIRTYRNHRPGGSPFELPGTQDITCEVSIDQISKVRPPDHDRTQANFLDAHGLADLMADARDAWHARAAVGDLGALRARSRVQEARALTDPNGLGRYRALEWDIPDSKTWAPQARR